MSPHKNQYWLFPKIKDWAVFALRVALICNLIIETLKGLHPNRHLVSLDEKTGIQALERKEGRAPLSKGGHKRREFEYTRHGTTCLMAAFDVGTATIAHEWLNPTRKEEDFEKFVRDTTGIYPPKDEIIFLADHLNTHLSVSLVRWVAKEVGFTGDLGKKGKKGILANQESRLEFLERTGHHIRFVFTPKHCSWLNPVENWFAKLQAHVITHGNFSSVKELNEKISAYVRYYNQCLVKPFNWKFTGFKKPVEFIS